MRGSNDVVMAKRRGPPGAGFLAPPDLVVVWVSGHVDTRESVYSCLSRLDVYMCHSLEVNRVVKKQLRKSMKSDRILGVLPSEMVLR